MALFDGGVAQVSEALSEVVIVHELDAGLDAFARAIGASRADYLRFPRRATGTLGQALLALPATHEWCERMASAEIVKLSSAEPICGLHEFLFLRLDQAPFGERGSAGVIAGRAATGFSAKDLKHAARFLPLWLSAHRRIRKFDALSGQNSGLAALIEQRLGACAALATPQGELVWVSQSAREVLGDGGRVALEALLAERMRALAVSAGDPASELLLTLDSRHRLFVQMSLVRESPQTSVHFIALQMHGNTVQTHAEEYKLTRAEVEILKLLRQGKSNSQIAAARFVSLETVRSHVKRLFRKLGVRSRIELIERPKPDPTRVD